MESNRLLCKMIESYLLSLKSGFVPGVIRKIQIRENGEKCEVVLIEETKQVYPPTTYSLVAVDCAKKQVEINTSALSKLPKPELSSSFVRLFQKLEFTVKE